MKQIIWRPGYYEWHLLIDGNLVYVEGDTFLESINEEHDGEILISEAEAVVSDLVNYIRYQFIEDEEYQETQAWIKEAIDNEGYNPIEILKSLTDEEWKEIEKVILNEYCYHYNIKN